MNATTKALFDTICRGIGARDPENTPKANNAVTELARAIDSLEAEAATAAASLEAAKGSVKIYAKAAGYEGADSLSGFAEHLKELVDGNKAKATHITNLNGEISALQNQLREAVERNKTQAEYFDKLCKITSSPSHDLDELVKDVRALKSAKEMIETYRDDWRAQSRAKDAELKEIREDRDDWRERAERQLAENERLVAEFAAATQERDRIAREMIAAQRQSQPQPPNSYLAKEVERLQAEEVIAGNRIKELKLELQEERSLRKKWENVTEVRIVGEPKITGPLHFMAYQPDPLEEAEHERRKLVTELGAKMAELNAAEEEIRSLRAERDRYAKIIDRL